MTEAIIVACITAGATVLCQLMINRRARDTAEAKNKENNQLILYRIDELEQKVMKHNNLVERMTVVERDLKSAHRRLDELREELERK